MDDSTDEFQDANTSFASATSNQPPTPTNNASNSAKSACLEVDANDPSSSSPFGSYNDANVSFMTPSKVTLNITPNASPDLPPMASPVVQSSPLVIDQGVESISKVLSPSAEAPSPVKTPVKSTSSSSDTAKPPSPEASPPKADAGSVPPPTASPKSDRTPTASPEPPAPPPVSTSPPIRGEKSSSGFTGNNGGEANDPELLALLKGISSGGNDKVDSPKVANSPPNAATSPPAASLTLQTEHAQTPPAPPPVKDAVKEEETKLEPPQDELPPAPPPATKISPDSPIIGASSLSSNFSGKNGGDANDAELLALLKGISSTSSPAPTPAASTSPNVSPNKVEKAEKERERTKEQEVAPTTNPQPFPDEQSPASDEQPPAASFDPKSTSWKTRKSSFEAINEHLKASFEESSPVSLTSVVVEDTSLDLDASISAYLSDSNAAALDAAVALAVTYSRRSSAVATSNSQTITSIAKSLVKSAFASSRASTVKQTKELVVSIMTHSNGPSNLRNLVSSFLTEGLASKKPKVHHASLDATLDACSNFGAKFLPLSTLVAAAPKITLHSDGRVREKAVEILAEICRSFGSKDPIKSVVSTLKDTQQNQLDAMVESKPNPSKPKVADSWAFDPAHASITAESVQQELEEEENSKAAAEAASRGPVDLLKALDSNAEYKAKVAHTKWSEIVAGLNLLISLAGSPNPYKLQRGGDRDAYKELVVSLKKLLSHSHYSVASHSMKCLAVLFEGVGPSIYSHAKPLVKVLLDKAKDKKLTSTVLKTLSTAFGNVVGFSDVLEEVDANSKDKNSVKRATGYQWLLACVTTGLSSELPKAELSPEVAESLTKMCIAGLSAEAEVEVKKDIMKVIKSLMDWEEGSSKTSKNVIKAVNSLQASNPRAFASLTRAPAAPKVAAEKGSAAPAAKSKPKPKPKQTASAPSKTAAPVSAPSQSQSAAIPDLDEAFETLAGLSIPDFDADLESNGVKAGLEGSAWQKKKAAIDNLATFMGANGDVVTAHTLPFLGVLKHSTRGFKDSNFNVMKSVHACVAETIRAHSAVPSYLTAIAITIGVEKIADKKLSESSKELLSLVLTSTKAAQKKDIVRNFAAAVKSIKSPANHEELLKLFTNFVETSGAKKLSVEGVKAICEYLCEEARGSNPKVKSATSGLAGAIHKQIGLPFMATITPLAEKTGPTAAALFKDAISKNPHDASSAPVSAAAEEGDEEEDGEMEAFELPRADLFQSLPKDILAKMGQTEGKNAWKARKEAMEEVKAQLEKAEYLVKADSQVHDLLRSLKERLSDSQSNLKPLAAGIIADMIFSLDAASASKYCKVVTYALVTAAMSDNKKIMRDAVLAALERTTHNSASPKELNLGVLNAYLAPLTQAIKEGNAKSVGLSEVLAYFAKSAVKFAKFDRENAATKQVQMEQNLSMEMLNCLSSGKVDVRSEGEKLLSLFLEHGILTIESVNKGLGRLKPAQQRDVGSIVSKISAEGKGSGAGSANGTTAPAAKEKSSLAERAGSRRPSIEKKKATKKEKAAPVSAPASVQEVEMGEAVPANSHPFFGGAQALSYSYGREYSAYAPGKEQRICSLFRKKECWPEFPELPHALTFSSTMTKNWTPLLNGPAAAAFFPKSGMKKQDESIAGCQILSRAIEFERDGALVSSHVCDQLDMILKWMACAVCAKDHTSGLEALLNTSCELFDYLIERDYELLDTEAKCIVPIYIEKSAVAKGRFVEKFSSLLARVAMVLPPKSLGFLCMMVLDYSKNQKARAAALTLAKDCVGHAGPGALGKKGLISAAKSLDGTIADVREAALNVFEVVLIKLSGDKDKIFRLLGNNLSARGSSLISERAKRLEEKGYPDPDEVPKRELGAQDVKTPTTRRGSKSGADATPKSGGGSTGKRGSLDLRIGAQSMLSSPLKASNQTFDASSPSGPFKFVSSNIATASVLTPTRRSSFGGGSELMLEEEAVEDQKVVEVVKIAEVKEQEQEQEQDMEEKEKEKEKELAKIHEHGQEEHANGGTMEESSTENPNPGVTTGAAASLRARLAAIRGRGRQSSTGSNTSDASAKTAAAIASANEAVGEMMRVTSPVETVTEQNEKEIEEKDEKDEKDEDTQLMEEEEEEKFTYSHSEIMGKIDALLAEGKVPNEEGEVYLQGKEALKVIHSAITTQKGNEMFADVTSNFSVDTSKCVKLLAEVFKFSFQSEEICVPLLSLALACLMAVFRGSLAKEVDQTTMQYLVLECSRGLLEPRLNTPSPTDQQHQLVKAINKLTIQSIVCSSRTVSIQCLLSLFLQLSKDNSTKMRKVCTKLLARVMKAEVGGSGGNENPFGLFGGEGVECDIEAVICCLEDFLVEAGGLDGSGEEEARKVGKGLLLAIVGEGGATRDQREVQLRKIMTEDLEFDRDTTSIVLLDECINSGVMTDMFPVVTPLKKREKKNTEEKSDVFATPKAAVGSGKGGVMQTPALKNIARSPIEDDEDDLAMLVAEIGSAVGGAEKKSAMAALRKHTEVKKLNTAMVSEELDKMGLSTPFKNFVVKGMGGTGEGGDESKENNGIGGGGGGGVNSGGVGLGGGNNANVVNDRIAYLKKRLIKQNSGENSVVVDEAASAVKIVEDEAERENVGKGEGEGEGEGESGNEKHGMVENKINSAEQKVEASAGASKGVLSLRERLAAVKARQRES